MDTRIVAIILALLVALTGFFVIKMIADEQGEVPGQVDSFECRLAGGQCTDTCSGSVDASVECGEGEVCCVEEP